MLNFALTEYVYGKPGNCNQTALNVPVFLIYEKICKEFNLFNTNRKKMYTYMYDIALYLEFTPPPTSEISHTPNNTTNYKPLSHMHTSIITAIDGHLHTYRHRLVCKSKQCLVIQSLILHFKSRQKMKIAKTGYITKEAS